MSHTIFIKTIGQGYPLVFFHGWGFSHQIWSELIPQLSVNHTLYLVDLPGFGQTEMMDWPVFKALLLAQLPPQFAVLGWSMGGLYAIRLALDAYDRVEYLMSIASSPYCLEDDQWPGIEKNIYDSFMMRIALDPQKTVHDFLKLQSTTTPLIVESVSMTNLGGLVGGLRVLLDWDLREALMGYDKPSCFVFGRQDSIIPVQTMAAMQLRYPQFDYQVLRRAGHIPFLSHRDDFLSILRGFIS